MTGDAKAPADFTRINIDDPAEVRWWCETWNIREHRLRNAMAVVGELAKDVADYLGKSLPET